MNIKDIARICEVSPSTVSKILHGKDDDISAVTRKRVLDTVKEYQYVPYSKVIQESSLKSNTIGVLIPMNAYGAEELLCSIENTASDNGYSIILCNTSGDSRKRERHINILQNKRVDGVICVYQDREKADELDVPSVWIENYRADSMNGAFAQVCYEEKRAGYLAVNYLVECGHSKITCILREDDLAIEAGCIKAFQEKQLLLNKELIFKGTDREIRETGLTRYLDMDCTAVLCADTEIANLVYRRLGERGVTVPGGISVVSVRDGKLARQMFPELTAVQVPFEFLAEKAVESLLETVEKRESDHGCDRSVDLFMAERGSVKPPTSHIHGDKIVVVGSANMDCMLDVPHIPANGETLRSHSLQFQPGGKGANQAVGAGKLDGQVYMIGRLGNDRDGKELYNNLISSGVKVEGVVFDNVLSTGKAYVNVAPDGESTIVVYPGANWQMDIEQVENFEYLLNGAKYCLLSMEITEEIVKYTIQKCKMKNVEVILKPSVVEMIEESLFEKIDYFIPNEKELKQLIPGPESVEEKAEFLFHEGVKNVIVTLGHKGCYLRNKDYARFFPAADFYPVDTTGGADAFISAFAVYMSEGYDIIEAIGYATYAAGICITHAGVQTSMVSRAGLELYADEIRRKFL
ncbi:MAG: PfkB family carbohydrate kinase [Clostridiales bacterium]|nr:PfkB family carbohydrate kinase [Clostridiales bacterium]